MLPLLPKKPRDSHAGRSQIQSVYPASEKYQRVVSVRKVSGVTVDRCDAQLHYLPFPNGVPVQLEVLNGNSRNQSDRRLTECFLNHVSNECWFSLEFSPLIRVREEKINDTAD